MQQMRPGDFAIADIIPDLHQTLLANNLVAESQELKMDEKLVSEIQKHMKSVTTEKLLHIWVTNNREDYLDETFEAVRRILVEREEDIPAQQEYHAPAGSLPANAPPTDPDVILMRLAVLVASFVLGYGSLFLLLLVSGALRDEGMGCIFFLVGAIFSTAAAAPIGFIYGLISPRSVSNVAVEFPPATVQQLIDEYWEMRDWEIKWYSKESGIIATNCLDLRPPKGSWRFLGVLLILWFPLLGMFGGKEIIKVQINLVGEQRSELVIDAKGSLGTTEAQDLLHALQNEKPRVD